MNGYIKSYRKIEDNPIVCKDNDYFRVWYYLLHNATHNEYEVLFNGEKILLKKGQLITGRKTLANKCKISESKAERILKTFKIEHQIEQQTSNKNRLITILNWHLYQNSEQQIEQQVNNKWTTSEQQVNTNKNIKNVKNVKNNSGVVNSLFSYVEENFGRTLAPLEYEEIKNWKNNELTRYAIKQAILNGKYNIKYISRILSAYERENIVTVQQAQEREREYEVMRKKKQKEMEVSGSVPSWFNKEVKKSEPDSEMKNKMEEILKEYKK